MGKAFPPIYFFLLKKPDGGTRKGIRDCKPGNTGGLPFFFRVETLLFLGVGSDGKRADGPMQRCLECRRGDKGGRVLPKSPRNQAVGRKGSRIVIFGAGVGQFLG
jgi:hypothetical protein